MANRPASEQYSVTAQGYFILDATLRYTQPKWEVGMTIQNFLNTKWKETQFDTESKLQYESQSVSEIHFTPGSPFFLKLNFNVFF
jgi:outer membrane receptor protein involved in Fe transport